MRWRILFQLLVELFKIFECLTLSFFFKKMLKCKVSLLRFADIRFEKMQVIRCGERRYREIGGKFPNGSNLVDENSLVVLLLDS
jgi:hypothetical protein